MLLFGFRKDLCSLCLYARCLFPGVLRIQLHLMGFAFVRIMPRRFSRSANVRVTCLSPTRLLGLHNRLLKPIQLDPRGIVPDFPISFVGLVVAPRLPDKGKSSSVLLHLPHPTKKNCIRLLFLWLLPRGFAIFPSDSFFLVSNVPVFLLGFSFSSYLDFIDRFCGLDLRWFVS